MSGHIQPPEGANGDHRPDDARMRGSRSPGSLHATKTSKASAAGTQHHQRLTFKQKLHNIIQEGDEAQIKAQQQAAMQDRKSICVSLLVEGRPEAFIDFFGITHDQPAAAAAAAAAAAGAAAGSSGRGVAESGVQQGMRGEDLPLDSLLLLKEQMTRADEAMRTGASQEVFDAYRHLGRYFGEGGELGRAVFFYQKCLEVAQDSSWNDGELEASCALGQAYEALQQPALAVACHERCLELASSSQISDEVESAYRSLVQSYAQQAEQRERAGDLVGAAVQLGKCLEAANKCGDASAAGEVQHRMGLIAARQGDWAAALHHQFQYLELSRQCGDRGAQGAACVAYAECQERTGDLEGAVASLEAFLDICKGQDPRGQAIASSRLGCIHYGRGHAEQAVACFEKAFELARGVPERRLQDMTRVNLGIARSALRMDEYMNVVNSDLDALLRWRCAKIPFSDTM